MARVMLAWELGGGMGHAMPLAQLADALLQRGHQLHLVWKDLSLCSNVLGRLLDEPQLHIWQAPIWLPTLRGSPDAASYPELLLRAGYLNADSLLGCARAWRELMVAITPDLLVADYSPTAQLVARNMSMPVAMLGSGFLIPPALEPMPVFRDWEPIEAARLEKSEALVLTSCNEVLSRLGQPAMTALHQLLEVDERFLLGWPQLDHYRPSRAAQPLPSWGGLQSPATGLDPLWPTAAAPRIFGYLQRSHPAYDAIIACLQNGPWSSLVYVAGAPDSEVENSSGTRLQIVNRPVNVSKALGQAEMLLGYGGPGTVYPALLAGLPIILLPIQAENLLFARQIVAAGAGITLWPQEVEKTLSKAIDAVLTSPGFAAAARLLAARNDESVYGNVLQRIADRCEQLINARAR